MPRRVLPAVSLLLVTLASTASAQPKSYRIPDVDLKQQIIWGSTCESPDGFALAFGGQGQVGDVPRTRIKVDGKWVPLSDTMSEDEKKRFYLYREEFAVLAGKERD